MKRILCVLVLLCSLPLSSLASVSQVEIGSCSVSLFDDWEFTEYTGEFDKLSSHDRMLVNPDGDVILFSILSDWDEEVNRTINPHENNADLFVFANEIIKSFMAKDGSSIVTLGEIDGYPRITIIDESEEESKTQWFIFSDYDVVYIGMYSHDKYQLRIYNTALHDIKVQ